MRVDFPCVHVSPSVYCRRPARRPVCSRPSSTASTPVHAGACVSIRVRPLLLSGLCKPPSLHPRADTPSVYTTHRDFWGFLFRPSPHLYPLEVGPHCGYRKSGEAHLGSPAGHGRARPPNVFCCILGINVHPFDCLMTNNFLCFCRPQESFRIYL